MILGVHDYIGHQVKGGIFSDSAAMPENDPRVLSAYYGMIAREFPAESDFAIHLLCGKYGFFRDPVDDVREGLNWAMTTPIIDMNIGVPFASFAADLPRLREEAGENILTDSFSFSDGFGMLDAPLENIVRLNSPVADISMPFDAYLESLTSDRRKKYRRMVSDFEKTPLTFVMSGDGLSEAELDFARINLEKKWAEDWGYALRQSLWAVAVQQFRPQQCLTMRVYDGDKMVFVQTMIVKGKSVVCQSITKDEDSFFSGLAAFTDFKCIEYLCGNPAYAVFDASCRTSLGDPESIGIAKRATVNRDCVKPLLAIGKNFPAETAAMIETTSPLGKEA